MALTYPDMADTKPYDRRDQTIKELTSELQRARQTIVEYRLGELKKRVDKHDVEIEALTETSTQFKLLLSLTAGGGMLSSIGLIKIIFFS